MSYFFHHNTRIKVTPETYAYVREYKKQLLMNMTLLLNDLNIKFVISHGNLIEYERESPIYHDDDLDIRFDKNDLEKWISFLNTNSLKLNNYNLKLCKNILNIYVFILIKFNNPGNILEYNMSIYCDFVINICSNKFWYDYDIDYNNLRTITYLETTTFAPSKDDTIHVLSNEYGKDYLIPDKRNQHL
jgi:hypothetical protein